jgi:hypothetical protein
MSRVILTIEKELASASGEKVTNRRIAKEAKGKVIERMRESFWVNIFNVLLAHLSRGRVNVASQIQNSPD